MPKVAKVLAAVEVARLHAVGTHAVGGVPGLLLRVAPSGSTQWVLKVRAGGKRRAIGLGGYPGVTLAEARGKAREARASIARGVDVVGERKAARARLIAAQAAADEAERFGLTFEAAARAKWQAIAPEFRSAKHRMDWISSLERYAFPIIGKVPVSAVEVAHVLAVLQPIWSTRTVTATRVRERLEKVLDWATVTHHRSGENPARWAGNLKETLPDPSKIAHEVHRRALDWHDVPAFMAKLRKVKGASAACMQFAILTGARSLEARGCEWGELDIAARTWRLPGARMKSGKPHTVPLSDDALALVQAQPRLLGSRFVFPSPREHARLSDMALLLTCRRVGIDATPHGFRASFKSWAQTLTAYRDEVSELCLAHTNGNATRAAYARADLLPERAKLLQAWATFCREGLPDAASVTPIRREA